MPQSSNIVITGGSRGIGRAISILFARNGWNVAFCSRSADSVQAHLEELKTIAPNGDHFGAACDAGNKDEVTGFCNNVKEKYGKIDCLVNNAGTFIPGTTIDEADGALESMISNNLYSAYYITRGLLPAVNTGGHIFNICSVASIKAYPNGGSYSISKFALLGYTKTLREELKPKGIKVTAVIPGATKTDSWASSGLPDERFMQPEDIAKSIWDIYNQGPTTVVEEIILRPLPGDI